MKDQDKTKRQLIDELAAMHKRVVELEKLEIEWKQADEALKASESRYRRLFETAQDGILILDAETGHIEDVNPFLVDMLGYRHGEIIGKKLWEVGAFKDIEISKRAFTELQRKGYIRYEDLPLETKDGREIAVEFVSNSYMVNHKKVIQCNIRDMTSHKQMEAGILKIRNLESIGTLAGGIAHDFNNLLMAVIGYISLARMYLSPDDKAFQPLAEAERISLSGKELTQRLITFSRGGAPIKKVITLNQLIKDISGMALIDSNSRCEYSLSDDISPVVADDTQIMQVIHNIVLNAREAMPQPQGGVIKIVTRNTTITPENTSLPTGDYVKISVEDQGIGIKEEDLSKVFDPYFTTKDMGAEKGMGLGLTVAYSIIKRHDGHIAIESKPDKGTTIHIYLPAYVKEVKKQEKQKKASQRSKGKVLFMDDEDSIRDMGGKILTHLGYKVVLVRNGTEAIEFYKDALHSERPFDAAILDLTVKGGIGGKKAMHELLSIDPDIKAIISSGYTDNPVISNYADYGFKGAITKPYRVEKLIEVLRLIMTEPTEGDTKGKHN